MNDTINDLNEIVELNSKITSKLAPQNLRECIQKSIQNLDKNLKDAKVNLVVNVDKRIEVLVINAYLESIVLNLITNAVKYRMPGRILLLELEAKIIWGEVMLSVKDNGLGIDLEKYRNKIFGLYKVFHDHKEARGVGLFIVKNQVEAMGGKIEVNSQLNKGTNFKVYFRKA